MAGKRELVIDEPEKPKSPKQTILDRIESAVLAERAKWVKEHSVNGVREHVRELLDGHYQHIILTYLGVKKDWGEWRVDRVNGRNSPISNEIETHAKAQAETLVRQHILDKPVKLTAAQIKALQKDYVDELLNKLRYAVRDQAQADANTYAEGILGADVDFVTREEAIKALEGGNT